MMFNRPRPLDVMSRLRRVDEVQADGDGDGPIALLRSLIALGLRHKISLLVCTIAGLVIAGLYAHSLPPTYNSTATLLLEPRQSAASGQEFGSQQNLDLNRADSELQTIKSERLLSAVFESLNLKDSPELGQQHSGLIATIINDARSYLPSTFAAPESGKGGRPPADTTLELADDAERAAFSNFARRLDARRVGQSFVIEIGYSSSDPTLPARVANAAVSGYIFQAVGFKEQIAKAGTEALQGRLDSLATQVEAARDAMHNGTLPSIPTPDADVRIIGAALAPLAPSAPRKSLITALGGLLGLLGGFGLIAINLALDRRVHNARDLSRDTGIVCLGSIPDTPGVDVVPWRIGDAQQQRFVAAIHDLRTSIEIACTSLRNDKSITIAFVAWTPDVGVSTVSSGLAQLISRSGRRVTIFQATEANDRATLDGIQAFPFASLADAAFAGLQPDAISFDEVGGVAVLPIHSKDANANLFADFRSPKVKQILDAARLRGDVLLDLPPLHGSMDALALANYADAVLVVARAEQTTVEEVADAVQLLRRAGANVVGVVINRARS
ncbi:Wzz/FepE/Etk N-terminal domain-containing protein [Rhizobium sp. Root1220]|uniref:Wzz/FepE/Etk N-terminal domain-containing protein n=1 Tax=Rhizobium sp. Root1220 TaxID=1736432 RepID=UPI0006FE3CE7|nr:Wzz/FepE/Etk N-terminal domain-containing protein [Rhizobium sp. Root1220]KQV70332.1 exopolysaccharide biosynthesis protein [Rhizobium sp. Root1220]